RPTDWLLRALDGTLAATEATKLFGDVLSYMRLFALGLASASLAATFNQLAAGYRDPARASRLAIRPWNQYCAGHPQRRGARSATQFHRILRMGSIRRGLSLQSVRTQENRHMNELAIILGWIGIYGVMALGAIGSIIGCATAGQAAIGA